MGPQSGLAAAAQPDHLPGRSLARLGGRSFPRTSHRRNDFAADRAWRKRTGNPRLADVRRLPPRGRLPTGRVDLRFEVDGLPSGAEPLLYFDVGLGFEADSVFRLPASEGGVISTTLDLPPELVALRFDPLEGRGTFQLGRLTLTEIAPARRLMTLAGTALRKPRGLPAAVGKAVSILRKDSVTGLRQRLLEKAREIRYEDWVAAFDTLDDDDRRGIKARIAALPIEPRFSVLMPVRDPEAVHLRRAIASVQEQLYPGWQLCIADD